jgi:propanol-preferring alcohol dehydrogenase
VRSSRLVFVALPADNEVRLPIFETVINGVSIVTLIVGTSCDLREECELQADGKAAMIRETWPLDQVNEPIADAETGRLAARIVFEP